MNKEREGDNNKEDFSYLRYRRIYSLENSESHCICFSFVFPALSEYDNDHALRAEFILRVPLDFFVNLLRTKSELKPE